MLNQQYIYLVVMFTFACALIVLFYRHNKFTRWVASQYTGAIVTPLCPVKNKTFNSLLTDIKLTDHETKIRILQAAIGGQCIVLSQVNGERVLIRGCYMRAEDMEDLSKADRSIG